MSAFYRCGLFMRHIYKRLSHSEQSQLATQSNTNVNGYEIYAERREVTDVFIYDVNQMLRD